LRWSLDRNSRNERGKRQRMLLLRAPPTIRIPGLPAAASAEALIRELIFSSC